ncbi:MAG TPA: PPC domain-containing protein [Candidatus Hydrogenedentes bacterium]|nr:PPC domain-containing protein [Candidatus Hydrogenedentota bacterium]
MRTASGKWRWQIGLMTIIFCATTVWAQTSQRQPHIGYLYPAGGQQGTIVEVLVGGQYLNGVNKVHVTGEGVTASVIQYAKPLNNKDLRELRRQLTALLKVRRTAEGLGLGSAGKKAAETVEEAVLPEHPLLRNIPSMSVKELEHWMDQCLNMEKRQANAQLGDTAVLEVAIYADAAPGDRELRLYGNNGLTNPLRFQVGMAPEIKEQEPNDLAAPPSSIAEPPAVLNGQILPGDVDRFRFRARQGQTLVIQAQARNLMPYLADAVPGWFQAVLAVYDANGKEVAYTDDYRFNPDPVLFYKLPEDGEYEVEIRDSIYRGRDDFVYRVSLGEQPFITSLFPLGGRTGVETTASISGWNLPTDSLALDTQPGVEKVRQTYLQSSEGISNPVSYAVDTLPECTEAEPNDTPLEAQRITPPQIVNGRIGTRGEIDIFRFEGLANNEIVAEIYARRLNSPLDSVLRLIDAAGNMLAWNDDHEDKGMGLMTHHADSCLRVKLPMDGEYFVQVADAQQQGGEAYAYRLRVGTPQPDFALRVTPSSISAPAGRTVPLCVHVLRKDGLTGDIEVKLIDAPAGFVLTGGRIPSGQDRIRMTLTAPRKPIVKPVTLHLEGCASLNGETLCRGIIPAEDMMQAFIYWHLTPAHELLAIVPGVKRPLPPIHMGSETPVRIPAGGTAQVQITVPQDPKLQEVQLALMEPPKGISLQDVSVVPEGLTFTLKAEGDNLKAGYMDNLIVEALIETDIPSKNGKAPSKKQRISLGALPALPIEVVQ